MLGSGFHAFFQKLNRTQWYKPERLKRFQESKLRALIKHAYYHVPHYHKIFKEINIKPEDVKTIEDLRKLPILTKADIKKHFSQFIAMDAKDYKYGTGKTSGTTGSQQRLTFLLDQQNREMEYASLWRQRIWAKTSFNSRIATFRSSLAYRRFEPGKPCWKFNALSKTLEFNIHGIDKNMLRIYVEEIKKFCPDLIVGYPSAIQLLAMYISEYNVGDVFPRAIQTSSETLSDSQRDIIEEGFHCKVYDWYAQSEYVVSAGQCPEGNYHVVESGIIEFIRDGERVGEGEIGEMVGTGLYNYSMPFIRYRLGDVGTYSEEKCSCGRGLPIVHSLEGRTSDFIITPEGKLVSGTSFAGFWRWRINPHTPNVDYVHIIQKSKRKLLIEMVKKEQYSEIEEQAILKELRLLLGSNVEIEFRELDSIPMRYVGRKWRFVESELDVSLV